MANEYVVRVLTADDSHVWVCFVPPFPNPKSVDSQLAGELGVVAPPA